MLHEQLQQPERQTSHEFFFFLIFYLVLIHVGDYPQGSHINHKSITLNVSLFAYSYESLLFLGVEYSKIK